jgi:hypothetical protein
MSTAKKQIIILSLIIITGFINKTYSQYLNNELKPAQRIFYGGNFGMSFGSVNYIELNPIFGYRINDRLSAGLGISYTYVSSKQYDYSGYCYGGNVFASFAIVKDFSQILPINFNGGLLIYGENALLNIKNYYHNPNADWINSPMLGAGLQIPISSRSYFVLTVLYNFNENEYSQYTNPVVRVAFQF